MKTRDFINIGVFTAIYFVLVFGTGMLGIINPAMMFVIHPMEFPLLVIAPAIAPIIAPTINVHNQPII